MEKYLDYFGNEVYFSHQIGDFDIKTGHVLVLCKYKGKWVLTRHSRRGLEFPGGKIEKGETPVQAAIREVNEETGGIIKDIYPIGEYKVNDPKSAFVKSVFFAELENMEDRADYMETEGPQLLDYLPEDYQTNSQYSFIMKDRTIPLCCEIIKN